MEVEAMRYARTQFVTSQSMAVDSTSKAIDINQDYGYAVQANYTTAGALGGTLSLEVSADHKEDAEGNVQVAGNFVQVANSPVVLTGAGSFMWNVTSGNYGYVRLKYAHAGGDSGSLNAFITQKGM